MAVNEVKKDQSLLNMPDQKITVSENHVTLNSPNEEIAQTQKQEINDKLVNVVIKQEDTERVVSVKVVNNCLNKPYLGGFRNKNSGVQYHNAAVQTNPNPRNPKNVEVFCRDTQTCITRHHVQQTFRDTSTQMTKPGCFVSEATDKIIIPGPYISTDIQAAQKLAKVIVVQSYWRRWLATRFVEKVRKDNEARIKWQRDQEEEKASERAERLRSEFERRMNPKKKADFDLLYAALERWRRAEILRIDSMNYTAEERKQALVKLLQQESYMIQSIERHRIIADKTNLEQNIRSFLDKAAQPRFWRAFDGGRIEMNTTHILRAQELRDLYNSLQMTYLNVDERLDVLLTLKHTIKEHPCKLTEELMGLIDREADLLTRGVKADNLEGLRQRVLTLYFQYCKTTDYNPEVSRLLKVPQTEVQKENLRKDIYFCPSCNAYLPSTEFPLASNSRMVGRCKRCTQLDNNARLRNDFTKIRVMLQQLRRAEESFDDLSKMAHLIQDADLQYLIENIWNSQSALSGCTELYDLVLVRWNKHEHWTPWNCILLSKDEASAHYKLENTLEAYGRIFIGKVHHHHVLAKNYFSKLSRVSERLLKNNQVTTKTVAT